MNGTKEYSKAYVYGLNQQVRILKAGIKEHRKLNLCQSAEINRLKKVCCDSAKELTALEKAIIKVKRWYQIIIWIR